VQQKSPESEHAGLFCALQFADSFFPGGGVSLSWGLEQLRSDGELRTGEELAAFVEGQLIHRWATFDAPVISSAWHARGDLSRLCMVDSTLEAMTLPAEFRDGSRRAGSALLNVHERLGSEAARSFRSLVTGDKTPGHLAVAQGLVWQEQGVPEVTCRAMAAHLLVTSQVSAALRLGLVGHLQAQAALSALRPVAARLLENPVPPVEEITAFTPATDVAAMRHERADSRLFAN